MQRLTQLFLQLSKKPPITEDVLFIDEYVALLKEQHSEEDIEHVMRQCFLKAHAPIRGITYIGTMMGQYLAERDAQHVAREAGKRLVQRPADVDRNRQIYQRKRGGGTC